MPFKRSKTYSDRVSSASKVGLFFSKRHLQTLLWPWRIVMMGIGWMVVLLPVVMIVVWIVSELL